MLHTGKRLMIAAALLGSSALYAAPAAAQATRTWVSGVGDDANPCSRTAPCKTFQGAISKTAAGGEINCIDPGGFGAVSITKSMTIQCDDTEAGILVAGSPGITVNAASTDTVTISGLDIFGVSPSNPGTNGINVVNIGTLNVRHTTIKGFANQAINFTNTSGVTSTLTLQDVIIQETGTSGNADTGAIKIAPPNNSVVTLVMTDTRVQNGVNAGLRLDLTGTSGNKVNAQVSNTTITNTGVGMLLKAPAGTGTINVTVTNSSVSNHSTIGVFGNGSGVTARFATTTISANGAGAAGTNAGVTAANSAAVQSYGNNFLNGNFNNAGAAANGAFTGSVAQQ
jgi:hypothetical protein